MLNSAAPENIKDHLSGGSFTLSLSGSCTIGHTNQHTYTCSHTPLFLALFPHLVSLFDYFGYEGNEIFVHFSSLFVVSPEPGARTLTGIINGALDVIKSADRSWPLFVVSLL